MNPRSAHESRNPLGANGFDGGLTGGSVNSSTITVTLRSLLGLAFLVFGLNKFLHFIPNPAEPPAAMEFFGALFKTGYFLPLLATTEVVSGALLVTNVMVPFALVLLAPVIVNIFMFHLFLAPGGLPIASIFAALEITLAGYIAMHTLPSFPTPVA
jgi:putative oxidoreductase